MFQVALIGHAKLNTGRAKTRISGTLSSHAVANSWWSPTSAPAWLNEEYYAQKIQPQLRTIKVREIAMLCKCQSPMQPRSDRDDGARIRGTGWHW